jgi:pyruvate/2-oxoglutarate dehydrogenase complex dihydrolipoamide acyltransferase (E2) component
MSIELRLPNFDLPGLTASVSTWHAAVGQHVVEGERLVEIAAGDVTVELVAPVSGVLLERCAAPQEPLAAGQMLARLRAD